MRSYGQGSYWGSKWRAAVYCGSVGQLLWATLQKFWCHPCSLVVAVSKAAICNLLLPKTSWLLHLPNVKYWPLHSSCLVTHERDCDAELIWFFAQHLLWWNSSVWRSTTVCQWWVSPSSPHLHEVLTIQRVLIHPCSGKVLVDTSPASLQLFLFLLPLLPNSQMLLLHVFKIPLDYICLRGWVNQ